MKSLFAYLIPDIIVYYLIGSKTLNIIAINEEADEVMQK